MLAQVLLVPDLEAGVVHERDQVAGSLELPVGEHDRLMNPPLLMACSLLVGRVMQWLSSRPPGFSLPSRNEKYAGRFCLPMCSVSPMELTASKPDSITSR